MFVTFNDLLNLLESWNRARNLRCLESLPILRMSAVDNCLSFQSLTCGALQVRKMLLIVSVQMPEGSDLSSPACMADMTVTASTTVQTCCKDSSLYVPAAL